MSRFTARNGAVTLTVVLVVILPLILLIPFNRFAHSQNPPTVQTLESDNPRVVQSGTWSSQAAAPASSGSYLFSSGAETDALALAFVGSAIEIIYVAGPSLGTLAIEVDGTVLRTVITAAETTAYAQSARVDYLTEEPHSLKVYAQAGGVIAVDAFVIIPHTTTTLARHAEDGGAHATTCTPINAIHRVSVTSEGAEADAVSASPSLSGDGRYVAFQSAAALTAGDTNTNPDIYVFDRYTCGVTLISVSSSGVVGNGDSSTPAISANGRYVAFESDATNLVTGDGNGQQDIFVYDRQTATTTRVSVATGGAEGDNHAYRPVISGNGRLVAFDSAATTLVGSDSNGGSDVFVHDRQTATTTRASIDSSEGQATGGHSINPSITVDGRYVAFESTATNLVGGDTNTVSDIFVRNLVATTTTRASVTTGSNQATGASFNPSIQSYDFGAFDYHVAFESDATNLVSGDSNGFRDVFVRASQGAGITTRASVTSNGSQAVGGNSQSAAISSYANYVVFESSATNLVTSDSNGQSDVFLRNLVNPSTARVSVGLNNQQASGGGSLNPAIVDFWLSSNVNNVGYFVAFESSATNLVSNDGNGQRDIFVTGPQPAFDQVAIFQPQFEIVGRYDLHNSMTLVPDALTAFSAFAPPTNAGRWVMGDWDGDGQDSPGVYVDSIFYFTNEHNESQTADWLGFWIGLGNGLPVAGRFDDALSHDCIGVVDSSSYPPYGSVFVLYYTCDMSGNSAPALATQWLSAVLPDNAGFTGTHQFGAGDFDNDGDDSIAVRRGPYIAFGNVAPPDGPAAFPLAQYFAPLVGNDEGLLVVGDWDGDGVDTFGLYYQVGQLAYRNNLDWNSGITFSQGLGVPFAGPVQASSWE